MSEHTPTTIERYCDVAVVGGSAAGLAAALQLGRQRRSVIVIDAGEPRNAPAAHMHSYLSREGASPAELTSIGREEVRSYGGEILHGRVDRVTRTDVGHFRVDLAGGHSVVARRVLAATGLVDELPDIEGLARAMGQRGHPLPVLPRLRGSRPGRRADRHPPDGAAPDRVVPPTHPRPDRRDPRPRRGRRRSARRPEGRRGQGRSGTRDAASAPRPGARSSSWPRANSSEPTPSRSARGSGRASSLSRRSGFRPRSTRRVSGTSWRPTRLGETAVPGLYAAGNVTDPSQQVLQAAANGSRVGAMISFSLADEDLRAAARPSADEADWDHRYSGAPDLERQPQRLTRRRGRRAHARPCPRRRRGRGRRRALAGRAGLAGDRERHLRRALSPGSPPRPAGAVRTSRACTSTPTPSMRSRPARSTSCRPTTPRSPAPPTTAPSTTC